jgi:hypothetical protein
MSRCSSAVLTVNGRVGFVELGSTCGSETTVMMSGACPPPAPSVWYAWMPRPPIAASVSPTNPASLSVSVWMATWMPVCPAMVSEASMTAGVEPQSSCSFSPSAPPRICDSIASWETVLPLPSRPMLSG